jgi:hypothetical protein
MTVVAMPIPGDPGHAEIPELNAANRKDSRTLELEQILANLSTDVIGPFTSL